MNQNGREFLFALVAAFLITAGYVWFTFYSGTVPASGAMVGHLIGVAGFILMLMTETLYSLRKRIQRAGSWGSTESWLKFHIFTGIVGPYMVLLHTAWRFSGLAGLVTLMTLVVVTSGFIGRYIYTLVPRSAEGVEIGSGDLATQLLTSESEVRNWLAANPAAARQLPDEITSLPVMPYNTWPVVLGRFFSDLNYRWRWWRVSRRIKEVPRRALADVRSILMRRRRLYNQVAALALVRRVLALWHVIHVPLGIVLFTLAFIHIGAAVYYVTLAR